MPIRYLRDKKRFRFEFEATINGQRIRATKTLPAAWSKAQAAKYDERESARLYAEAAGIQRPQVTIDQAVSLYIKEKCPQLKTGENVIQEFGRFANLYMGRLMEELPQVAKEYQEMAYRDDGKTRLTPATIRNRLAYLRAACRYAYRFHHLVEHDPAERMQLPKVKNERHYYATREQMLTICRAMSNKQARAVVRVAFYSGMRLGEILRAELLERKAFLLADTKNGDRRVVPVHPRIKSCLGHFPIQIKKITVQRQFLNASRAVGLGHLHFHDLRHSAASEMINSGVSLNVVGGVLGHKDLRSTRRYAHLLTDTLADAVRLIGKKSRTAAK